MCPEGITVILSQWTNQTSLVCLADDKFSLLARVRNLFPCWQSWSTVSSVRIMKLLHVQLCLTIFTFVASLPQVRAM